MSVDARSRAWAALALTGVPQRELVDLLRAFETPDGVIAASRRQVDTVVPAATAERLARGPDAAHLSATLEWLSIPGHRLIAWDDPDYPRSLLDVADAPAALFYLGRPALLNRTAVAIVGSRQATAQGRDDAHAFAHALSAAGVTIVSGLALGIDAAAHQGALAAVPTDAPPDHAAGATIAVVGTGLDRVYPARNRALAHAIAERGGMLSEFAPGTPPLKGNFPRRNRLISGLARGVLVVEATLSSGSLITARLAGEQGRDVFALPGSIHSPLSRGCHKLIRDGAKLTETVNDILSELGGTFAAAARPPPAPALPPDDPVQAALWSALSAAPVDLDRLVARTGLAAQTVAATLTVLELEGRAISQPGGLWLRRG